jgi:hypothetical protein
MLDCQLSVCQPVFGGRPGSYERGELLRVAADRAPVLDDVRSLRHWVV